MRPTRRIKSKPRKQPACPHETRTQTYVVSEDERFTGETSGEWVEVITSTTVDIDLHRYRCTQCGTILYYSGRAEAFFERGVRSDVHGLTGR